MKELTNKNIKIGVAGGDLRSLVCAKKLAQQGFETALYGFSDYEGDFGGVTRTQDIKGAVSQAQAVVLPVPVTCDGKHLNTPFSSYEISLSDIFCHIHPETKVLAGHVCDKTKVIAKKFSLDIIDYSERDEFKIQNAVPTAEGALAIAINETPKTLHDAKCLVIGYGRIGKILCSYLKSLGANVTASARKYSDFAWIKANGLQAVHTDNIPLLAGSFDIIFNTVPTLLIGKTVLGSISKDTLILDLASKPGGVDFDEAKELGLNVIWALSLPGKTAPVSSGEIMCDSIMNILKEENVV